MKLSTSPWANLGGVASSYFESIFFKVCILLSLLQSLTYGDVRGFGMSAPADWVMLEERRPYFAGSHWSPFSSQNSVVGENNQSFSYYTGMGNGSSPDSGYWHWSTWPVNNPTNPGDGLKIVHLAATVSGHEGGGGEGTSAGSTGVPTFGFATNVWYRFAIRCWRPADGTMNTGFAGQWIRNGNTGEWCHMVTYKVPFSIRGVDGVMGFVERLSKGSFEIHHRGMYSHTWNTFTSQINSNSNYYGRWNSSNLAQGGTWNGGYVGLSADGTHSIMRAIEPWTPTAADPNGNTTPNPNSQGNAVDVTINQPATPVFDPILVTNQLARVSGTQLMVQWNIPVTSSPQLGYRIEVFNNASYSGTPALNFYELEPGVRQKLLNVSGIATPYVRLTIADIFNNVGAPNLMTPSAPALLPATTLSSSAQGLNFSYYENASNPSVSWSTIPNFTSMTSVVNGSVEKIDTTVRRRRYQYGLEYTGYINVPNNGIYSFGLTSFDSSKLFIDGIETVNFDGLHNRSRKVGWAALAAGKHAIKIQYAFTDQRGQGKYWDDVQLDWEGPGVAETVVPMTAWSRVPVSSDPVVTLLSPTMSSTLSGAEFTLSASIVANGNAIEKVQYYINDVLRGEVTTPPYILKTLVGTANGQVVHARAIYSNGTRSMDSIPSALVNVTQQQVSPWTLTMPGSYRLQSSGASVNADKVSLVGDSINFMTRTVTGDCTLIARVADLTKPGALPDGSLPSGGGMAGIILRQSLAPEVSTPLGGNISYAAAFVQVDGSVRYEDPTMSGANDAPDRRSDDLSFGNRWLKLVRTGDTFVTSVSPNRIIWKQVNTVTLPNFGATVYAGVFQSTDWSELRYAPHASFDGISLSGNVSGAPTATATTYLTTIPQGQSHTVFTSVVGSQPQSYQWQFNGVDISGQTGANLTLSSMQSANVGC